MRTTPHRVEAARNDIQVLQTLWPVHGTGGLAARRDASIDDCPLPARLLLDGDQPQVLCEPDGRTRLSPADVRSFGDVQDIDVDSPLGTTALKSGKMEIGNPYFGCLRSIL